jgi:hypothetical protein
MRAAQTRISAGKQRPSAINNSNSSITTSTRSTLALLLLVDWADRAKGSHKGRPSAWPTQGLTDSLAGLYGNSYNADQNRGLTQYGMDWQGYNQGRSLDQSGAALGASLWGLGNAGAWGPLNQASGVYSPYTGFGQTTQTGSQGGGWGGAIGGALGAGTLGNNLGWWGK